MARLASLLRWTAAYQVVPEQPPLLPPDTAQVRVVVPFDAFAMVKGLPDVWVRLGRCCTPVPGDPIVGFVTRGQGVSVHREDCPNVKTLRRERRGHVVLR